MKILHTGQGEAIVSVHIESCPLLPDARIDWRSASIPGRTARSHGAWDAVHGPRGPIETEEASTAILCFRNGSHPADRDSQWILGDTIRKTVFTDSDAGQGVPSPAGPDGQLQAK